MKFRGLLLGGVLALVSCSKAREPLPKFGSVPDFTLTSQSGETFHASSELNGKVWLANFIYASCPGPCPRMSSQMSQVQKAVQDVADIRLVSFSVDPKNDTPEALAGYAKYYGAQSGRWFFLTGAKSELEKLSFDAFKLSHMTDQLDHSTRFALVDRSGNIRKYYTLEGFNPAEVSADIKAVLAEAAS